MMRKILTLLILFCSGVVTAQNYQIGDLYTAPDGSQGIVFYVHPDGSGGWIVALNDASEGCQWGNGSDVPNLVNQVPDQEQDLLNDTAGYSNTQAMRLHDNNPNYAAWMVDFANGWYLPSTAQLSMLCGQSSFIANAIENAGGTPLTTDTYWSSSEGYGLLAWSMSNYFSYLSTSNKTSNCRVRAIRNFSYSEGAAPVSYLWNTGDITPEITVSPAQTTTYTVTVTAGGGCSSEVEQEIVVGASSNEEINQFACDNYEWNGQTYYQSGDYSVYYQNMTGCDSVVTLHLTIEPTPEATITPSSDVICEGNEVTLQTVATMHNTSVSIGDILCTDGTTVQPAEYPNSGKVAMGVVFYVDNTGGHGWAVNLHDQSIGIPWSPSESWEDIPTMVNYMSSRDAITDLDGYNNTMKIRAAGDNNAYPAAYSVDFANGWYLPAAGQLNLLYAELVTINASLQVVGGTQFSMSSSLTYWSSTERSIHYAYYLASSELVSGYDNKGVNFSVRSARDF